MARVEIQYDGVSRGARRAADETVASMKRVGNEAEKQGGRVRSSFGAAIGTGLGLAAKTAGAGVIALGGAVAFAGFRFDDLKQRANIAFTTMLGSGKRAQSFLADLQKFAAKTPFEFPELIQASQRLLAMGFNAKQVIPTMTAIGDSVAALGGSAETMDRVVTSLGQIQAKGKASAEEMLQLTEAGIPAWQMLADKIGKSVPEAMALVSKGAISADVTIAAVTQGMEKRFGGMMEKQSHTFSGLLSNVKDTFTQLSGTVMAPFFNSATKGLERIVKVTSDPGFTAGVERFGKVLSTQVAPMFRVVLNEALRFVRAVGPPILGLARTLIDAWQKVGPIVISALRPVALIAVRIFKDLVAIVRAAIAAVAAVIESHRAEIERIFARIAKVMRLAWIVLEPVLRFIFTQVLPRMVGYAITILDKLTGAVEGIVKVFRNVWNTVSSLTSRFFNWLVKTALEVALKMVEPFSHLPGSMGGWARKAKVSMQNELDELTASAGPKGQAAGEAYGSAFYNASTSWLTKVSDDPGRGTGPKSANANAAAGGDLQTSLALTASGLGGGRGGHGGHGSSIQGVEVAYDCSGFVHQVLLRNGFDSPPETSETQWRTMSGPNWTSERISADQAGPGDVVFMRGSPRFAPPGHVGIITAGRGAKASVMAYSYESGRPPSHRPLGSITDLIGVKRFYLVKKKGGGGKKPAAAPPAAASPPTDYDELFGVSGDLIGTGTAGGAKKAGTTKKDKIDEQERDRAQSTATFIEKHYDRVLSPTLAKKLRARAEKINDELEHATSEKQLRALEKRLARLVKDYENAVQLGNATKLARAEAAKLSDAIGRLPDRMAVDLKKRMAKVQAELANVTSPAQLAKIKRELEAIQDAVNQALDKLRDNVERKRDAFGQAWGRLADKALQVFDAKTEELIRRARAKVAGFGFETGEGEMTPAERALEQFRKQREAADRARERSDRAADFAKRLAEAETPEDRAAIQAEMARQAQQDALDDQERSLEKQAELERAAADKALEEERARIEDERTVMRERFSMRMSEIETAYMNESISADEAQRQLLALFSEYGIDYANAGALVGAMFAQSFLEALGAVADAIIEVAAALNELAGATGTAGVGSPQFNFANLRGLIASKQGAISAILQSGRLPKPTDADPSLLTVPKFAGGGRVPGQYIGRDDTVLARVTPGEEVIDRSLAPALRAFLESGGSPGEVGRFAGARFYVLGATDRQVAQALKQIVDGAPDSPSYSSRRG